MRRERSIGGKGGLYLLSVAGAEEVFNLEEQQYVPLFRQKLCFNFAPTFWSCSALYGLARNVFPPYHLTR